MAKKKPIKYDTSENWGKASFIPKDGEIILYTDILKIKIGNGGSRIGDLPFADMETPPFEGEFEIKEDK